MTKSQNKYSSYFERVQNNIVNINKTEYTIFGGISQLFGTLCYWVTFCKVAPDRYKKWALSALFMGLWT